MKEKKNQIANKRAVAIITILIFVCLLCAVSSCVTTKTTLEIPQFVREVADDFGTPYRITYLHFDEDNGMYEWKDYWNLGNDEWGEIQ